MSSNTPRRPVRDLRFFLTVPHACSYLPGKEATTLFLDPQESPVPGVYDSLALLGFRRSGRQIFRCVRLAANWSTGIRTERQALQPSQ